MLLNLLSNAIKFSKEGDTIRFKVRQYFNMEAGTCLLKIIVKDQGIGISAEDQVNLFQPFFRSQSQENRELNP